MAIEIYLLTFVTVLLSALYYILTRKLSYWEKKKVPHLKPKLLFGNYASHMLFKKSMAEAAQEICKKFPNEPYIGTYLGTEPALLVQNPELLKLIFTKDFYYFSGREISEHADKETFNRNLFSAHGDRWKVLRQNMTPLFSSSKMKNMFYLIEKCSKVFEKLIDEEVKISNEVDIRNFMSRFTMDCIGSCAFGVETNVMGKDVKHNPFKQIGDAIFEMSRKRTFMSYARSVWPSIFYGLGLQVFPKKIDEFFFNLMTGVFEGRNYQPTSRNDFVDLILGLKKNKFIVGDAMNSLNEKGKKISLEVDDTLLVAQCFIFFAAGFETSATTLSYTLYELAKHQDAQRKVLEEVDAYCRRHNNQLDYSCVTEMPYLETCIDEALRLYPVVAFLTREVVEDYTFPTGLTVEKGMRIHIPVYHLHHNPDFFPDPEEFRPERFSPEEKKSIIPYSYTPFGEGPRLCIGARFAKMQMMAGVITLLKKYRLELADGMTKKIIFDPTSAVTQPLGGIRLRLIEREDWQKRVFQ